MKKIFISLLLVLTMFMFVGCNNATGCNKEVFDLSYNYRYAQIKIGDSWRTVEIKKWCDYEGEQLQLELKDGTTLLVSSINCILFSGNLPD